jgi:hypothetical protein
MDVTGEPMTEAFQLECQIDQAIRFAQSVENESRTMAAEGEFLHAAMAQRASAHVGNGNGLRISAERNRQKWVHERISQEGLVRARRFGWFDTYTFTKAMAEQLLYKQRDGVPMVILRPSIVESSLAQPEPGWIEGFRMSSPIVFGFGKGVVPDFPGKRDSVVDFIPLDFVVSSLLASVPSASDAKGLAVFQVATGFENPLRLGELVEYCAEYFRQSPARFDSGQPFVPQSWKYRSPAEFEMWLACQPVLQPPVRRLPPSFLPLRNGKYARTLPVVRERRANGFLL